LVVTDANRSEIQALSKSFQKRLITLGKAAGWKLDDTADLTRVLRPVGTSNHKTAEPRPVTLLGYSGRRYSVGDLRAAGQDGMPGGPPLKGETSRTIDASGIVTHTIRIEEPPDPVVLMRARDVLARLTDPHRREIADLILTGAPLPQGSRDSSLQAVASWLASALPNEEPEVLASIFEPSLDAMAAENPDDHPSFEDVMSKISRAQNEIRPRREAEAAQDAGIAKALERAVAAATPPKGAPVEVDGVQTFPYGKGQFRCDVDGVWWDPIRPEELTDETDLEDAYPVKLCTPLRLLATARDESDDDWGTLVEIMNPDGRKRLMSVPLEALASSESSELRRPFFIKGARPAPSKKAREQFAIFFTVAMPTHRVRCVPRTGWYEGRYVLPETTIGEVNGDERVVYQSSSSVKTAYEVKGTKEEWREQVAAPCAGNSRFVLGVSAAFAGMLLDPAAEDGGGFHFRGPSSTSKTTILKVAASVFGKPSGYLRTWRATSNGLEGIAAIHNDGLLCIDELGQVEAKEAGAAAYMLANGQGKTRASRNGAAREAARWRLLFLSTGETSLAARAAETSGSARTQTGQEIRLAEVSIDAGAGMGGVEDLHGHATPAAFAEAIKDAASTSYGAVGQAWIELVVRDRVRIAEGVRTFLKDFVTRTCPEGTEGQVMRVARRFGLVAYAGELATAYGLTAWPSGEATKASETCFAAWLSGFGGAKGQHEDRSMIAQVRAFLEAHGSSRFEPWGATEVRGFTNRVGIRKAVTPPSTGGPEKPTDPKKPAPFGRMTNDEIEYEYYVFPEAWKSEICKGRDPKEMASTLAAAGCLMHDGNGKSSVPTRLPGQGVRRCYVITPKIWTTEEQGL
jgi:uncharacterized protein (DUF927 family)